MHYHIGSNSPGYMPDEIPDAVSQADAYAVLVADMTAWAEDDDESYDALPTDAPENAPESYGSTLALVQSTLADEGTRIRLMLAGGQHVSVTLMGNDETSRVFFASPEDDADGCEVEL